MAEQPAQGREAPIAPSPPRRTSIYARLVRGTVEMRVQRTDFSKLFVAEVAFISSAVPTSACSAVLIVLLLLGITEETVWVRDYVIRIQ